MSQTNPAKSGKSTQNSLVISDIRDGVVVLRDGSLRSVIMGSAINFDLMSAQEQSSVEFAFQGCINSLHFTILIFIIGFGAITLVLTDPQLADVAKGVIRGGAGTDTLSPTFLPISAFANGEDKDRRACLISASCTPTIW